MKKSLLTAALVAGFAATGAQAETKVTLYGVLDGGIQYTEFKGTVRGGTVGAPVEGTYDRNLTGAASGVNSGNRWGLKGSEDLGDGLKAVFTLESGFDIADGTSSQGGRLFGRQATVGLESDVWGLIEIGRQTNIASKYFAGVASPFGTDFGFANIGSAFSAAGSNRYDNMVMYQTPKFSGFQFGVGYSFNANGAQNYDDANGNNPNQRAWTAGLRYGNGPIEAALTYDHLKNRQGNWVAGVLPANDTNGLAAKAWALAFSYDFEVVKVHLAGGQTRDGWFSSNSALNSAGGLTTAVDVNGVPNVTPAGIIAPSLTSRYFENGLKVNSFTLGLSAPVGANGKVMASWMMADPTQRGDVNPTAALGGRRDLATDKQHVYSLGYTYALSKRTNLYALASYANGVNFSDDQKATQVVAGLRHRF